MTSQHCRAWAYRNFVSFQICILLFFALAGSVNAASPAQQSYAKVLRLSGTVTAVLNENSALRSLKVGDSVFLGERIQSDASGEAVLQTTDLGYIAVRPGSVFLVEQFAANKQASDHISIRIIQGGLRLLTGWIGKLNPKGYRVTTPMATIGIRGTDHEPYVVTEELATSMAQSAGTYDKVNSGATVLEMNSKSVGVDPGRVGFARFVKPSKDRALMTLMLPVILEKVPEFFVPGRFDSELDRISSLESVDAARTNGVVEVAGQPIADLQTQLIPARLENGQCNASGVAKAWLDRLDGALARKDSNGVLSLLATDVAIRSVVKIKSGGTTTINVGREEFASSTKAMMESLSDYSQSRQSVKATTARPGRCEVVLVKSLTVEHGRQNGSAFSFKSIEEYQLELKDGIWLATKAATTQQ